MKKIFTSVMLLLAIAAGTTLVSCNKKNAEKKYTAEEQANKLDATGEAFIAELDLEKWQATADLVIPGIIFIENADMRDAEAPDIEAKEDKVDVANLKWTRNYTIDMANVKGHYTINAEGKGAKVKGDFADFQITFAAEGHDYVADIAFTDSDKTVVISYDEYDADYYYDAEDNYVSCPGMVRYSTVNLVVPSKLTIDFTVDGKKQVTAEGNLKFSGLDDYREIDVKGISVDVDLALNAGDYAINLSRLSLKNGTFDEALTLKHNKKQLLGLISKATGLNYIEKVGVKSGEEEENDFPYACDNASIALDVMGQVQAKGNLKFNDFYNTYIGMIDAEPKNVEEANALLKKLEPYYNINVYYDKGSTVQAYVRVKALEEENDRMTIAPIIFFQDGTSQAVTEFFNPDNFGKTIAAVEGLVSKVQAYFESFNTVADSELHE